MKNTFGKLFLIPTIIGENSHAELPTYNQDVLNKIDVFIVEEIRTARRFLVANNCKHLIDKCIFHEFNEHSENHNISQILLPALDGKNIGLMSEAGLPCIADPGEDIVLEAHRMNITVVPLVGPSSIFLALMASGLNGEKFIFHGYLPVEPLSRDKFLISISNDAVKNKTSQIFIETPYRNQKMFEAILSKCKDDIFLCIAYNLMTSKQSITTKRISDWKKSKIDFNKIPAIFIIGSE